jgi:hypothetical protein
MIYINTKHSCFSVYDYIIFFVFWFPIIIWSATRNFKLLILILAQDLIKTQVYKTTRPYLIHKLEK